MKTMAVSLFKAQALQTVAQVAKSRESVVITKRGKPLVQVIPFQPPSTAMVPGKLSRALVFEKDIVSPLEAGQWEANR
jgi:antitoxin (DNA-binding transcriptional repressor) of toxin-antitoxin stability system